MGILPAQTEGAAVRAPNRSVSQASNRRVMKDIGNLVVDINGNWGKVCGKPPRPGATRRITRFVLSMPHVCSTVDFKARLEETIMEIFGTRCVIYSVCAFIRGCGAASHASARHAQNEGIFMNKQSQAEAPNNQWKTSKRENILFAVVDAKYSQRTEDNSMIDEPTNRAFCGGFDAEMTEAEDILPSIDGQQLEIQMAVVDYVDDIYKFYHETESMSCVPDYMPSQLDLACKMRAMVVDWLVEVHWQSQLMPETLYLTINLIDRYLSIEHVSRKYLQLVGATAMFLACKYEEVCPLGVDDFVYYSAGAYTREQLLAMEKTMLSKLNFTLTVPTQYVFLIRCLMAIESDKKMDNLVFFLSELSLLQYVMIKFTPSLFAAAAVYTARCALKKTSIWNDLLTQYTGYTEADLLECANLMVKFHHNSAESSLKAVHEKYSSLQFGCVAFISPAKLPA